ncbi:MAG: hypothetical protein ACHBN1_01745 [Heteroscytonema crispum UTEX LB 1556]
MPCPYNIVGDKLEQILQRLGADWNARATEFLNLAQLVRTEQTEASENQLSPRDPSSMLSSMGWSHQHPK